jgi:hypothetical protein
MLDEIRKRIEFIRPRDSSPLPRVETNLLIERENGI